MGTSGGPGSAMARGAVPEAAGRSSGVENAGLVAAPGGAGGEAQQQTDRRRRLGELLRDDLRVTDLHEEAEDHGGLGGRMAFEVKFGDHVPLGLGDGACGGWQGML